MERQLLSKVENTLPPPVLHTPLYELLTTLSTEGRPPPCSAGLAVSPWKVRIGKPARIMAKSEPSLLLPRQNTMGQYVFIYKK
jgi:hypothetical protein